MAEWLGQLLYAVPPLAVYLVVGVVIGIESLGIPLPGEITLVTAAVMASTTDAVSPLWVGVAAIIGAVVGDSIGYTIGRRAGRRLLDWLSRRFPKHFSSAHVALAERVFERWGVWAVFFGRFTALLRIFAGPLAGVLRMPYARFLAANLLGGICWAGGTTALVYYLGTAAEHWLGRFAWIALVVAVLVGCGIGMYVKRRADQAARRLLSETAEQTPAGAARFVPDSGEL